MFFRGMSHPAPQRSSFLTGFFCNPSKNWMPLRSYALYNWICPAVLWWIVMDCTWHDVWVNICSCWSHFQSQQKHYLHMAIRALTWSWMSIFRKKWNQTLAINIKKWWPCTNERNITLSKVRKKTFLSLSIMVFKGSSDSGKALFDFSHKR